MTQFGAETTADEVLEGHDLTSKLAVVTGAASGIGLETARALSAKGAQVVMPVRDMTKGQAAMDEIRASVPTAELELMDCDLASLGSIRRFADAFLAKHDRLDLLINNAGIMASPLMRTEEGFEMQFGVCHVGHFLLTNLLMPALLKGAPSRIVNLSSRGHQNGGVDFEDPNYESRDYQKWESYGQAKTANILFTVELERRFAAKGVHAYAVHPGVIVTNLGRHLSEQDIADLQAMLKSRGVQSMSRKSIPQGAATTIMAAVSPELEGKGGVYLEDCHVASVNDDTGVAGGVRSYAIDVDDAKRLWALSEELIGESFAEPA